VASQESREKELNDDEMGAVRVATIVVSVAVSDGPNQNATWSLSQARVQVPNAARNTPNHIHPRIRISSLKLGFWPGSTALSSCSWVLVPGG
jgi:hypothetical protein